MVVGWPAVTVLGATDDVTTTGGATTVLFTTLKDGPETKVKLPRLSVTWIWVWYVPLARPFGTVQTSWK
jgi:hypothetical protein